MIRIALDAMGGDVAPAVPVAGALAAAEELPPSSEIVLVGRQAEIASALAAHGAPRLAVPPPGRVRAIAAGFPSARPRPDHRCRPSLRPATPGPSPQAVPPPSCVGFRHRSFLHPAAR